MVMVGVEGCSLAVAASKVATEDEDVVFLLPTALVLHRFLDAAASWTLVLRGNAKASLNHGEVQQFVSKNSMASVENLERLALTPLDVDRRYCARFPEVVHKGQSSWAYGFSVNLDVTD